MNKFNIDHTDYKARVRGWVKSTVITPVIILSIATYSVTHAEPNASWSGFGSLIYTVTDNGEVEYLRGLVSNGADNSGSFKVDSRAGLQVDAEFNNRFSGTIQGIVRQDSDGDVSPQVEWAYLRSQLNENIVLRIGQLADPVFMHSDFREVGYARPYLRMPEDVYRQSPIANINGLDLTTNFEFYTTNVSAQLFAGEKKFAFNESLDVDVALIYGINLDIEKGFARWRFGVTDANVEISSPDIEFLGQQLAGAALLFPSLQATAQEFESKKRSSKFYNIGVELDLAPWHIGAELLLLDSEALAPDTRSWYLAVGHRFNTMMPYVIISSINQLSKTEIPDLGVPQLAPLIAGANRLYSSTNQTTTAVGVRWEFAPKIALKAQFENIERKSLGKSFIQKDLIAPINNDDVQMFSIGLDFIF